MDDIFSPDRRGRRRGKEERGDLFVVWFWSGKGYMTLTAWRGSRSRLGHDGALANRGNDVWCVFGVRNSMISTPRTVAEESDGGGRSIDETTY